MKRLRDYVFYLLATLSGLWALIITFLTLGVLKNFAQNNLVLTVILFLLGIGWLLFLAPVITAWGGIYWLRQCLEENEIKSNLKYWFLQIGGFIGCITLSWIVFLLLTLILVVLAWI